MNSMTQDRPMYVESATERTETIGDRVGGTVRYKGLSWQVKPVRCGVVCLERWYSDHRVRRHFAFTLTPIIDGVMIPAWTSPDGRQSA